MPTCLKIILNLLRKITLIIFYFLNINLFADGLTETQIDRFNIKDSQTSKLLLASKELLKNQQYVDVIPFLEEVIYRLEDDKNKNVIRTLSFTKYQLAECYMRIGNFNQAAILFENFSFQFPENELRDSALILSSQNYSFQSSWSNASKLAHLALENLLLEDELKQKALKSASEADYQLQNWDKCIRSLEVLFRLSNNDKDKSHCAVLLVNCFSKKNNFYDLLKFLPFCSDESRNTLSLNAAIIEAGDYFYNNNEFIKAQLLYKEVTSKNNILIYHTKKLEQIRKNITPYKPGSKITLSEHKDKREFYENEKKLMEKKILSIQSFKSYDSELVFRLAQCAYECGRNWLSFFYFKVLIDKYPNSNLYDQSFYLSLISMIEEEEWDKVKSIGYEYIENNINGSFISEITLNLMMLHMQLNEFNSAKNVGQIVINQIPDHKYKDQIFYMLGYLHFSEMEYEIALSYYEKIISEHKSTSLINEVRYWHSMCYLYLSKFEDAASLLLLCIQNDNFKNSNFYEDSIFRLGVSYYGAEKYELSEEVFNNFIGKFPSNTLVSEAHAFIGDLHASEGELTEGLESYNLAIKFARNIEQINYPLFQKVNVLKIQKKYKDIIFCLKQYTEKWKEDCEYAKAIVNIGDSYKKIDEYPQSLQIYLDSIENYKYFKNGNIDKILNIIIDDYNDMELYSYREIINSWLHERIDDSIDESTPHISYLTILAYIDVNFPKSYSSSFLFNKKIISNSSPLTLNLVSNFATKHEKYDYVFLAQNLITNKYPSSDLVIDISQRTVNAYLDNKKFKSAEKLAKNILENDKLNYKMLGQINKLYADSLRLQNRFELAIKEYENILKERDWKGSLTPEVLYWIGMSYYEMEKYEQSYQYFQRIYILYGNYKKWLKNAYIMSINCLDKIGNREDMIINTYNEMIQNEIIQDSIKIKDLTSFMNRNKLIR